MRAVPRRAALLLAVALLPGCALLRPEAGERAAPEPPLPPPLALRIEVDDPALRALLREHLDLARLRRVAPRADIEASELSRLVAALPAQARALLETEGHFNARVRLQREPGDPPVLRVLVDPGPRTRVGRAQLEFEGELEVQRLAGEPRAQALAAELRQRWPLPPGAPFRNPAWSAAKTGLLVQLRAAGYPLAALGGSAAIVDAADDSARLFVAADSGPLFLTGPLLIQGLERQDEKTVRNLADFAPGTPASEGLLLDFQERLQRAGLYERATVTLDTEDTDPKAAPVVVQLRELPLQQASIAVGVDANTGPRASVEHWHRRAFGRAATARHRLEVGQRRQVLESEVASHPLPGGHRNLVSLQGERVESAVDVVSSWRLRLGRSQGTPRRDRFTFAQMEAARLEPADAALPREHAQALSLNQHLVLRRLDHPLLPTEGYTLSLQAAAGHTRSDAGSGPFGRLYGRLTVYEPLGDTWLGQARLEAGEVFYGRRGVRVPDTQQFRAGGDESVRGYAYRSLAPTVGGAVTGGNVLFTASAEVAHPFSTRRPALLGALFVDVGQAAVGWSALRPVWGAGAGLRWRSPVGPLKLDLAWGEAVQELRMHLSVGIAF